MERKVTWDKHCEAEFEYLSKNDPLKLIGIIESGDLGPALLSFAAEHLGKAYGDEALACILDLSHHEQSIVREGAVLGLGNQKKTPKVVERLTEIIKDDISPGVRETAEGVLDWSDFLDGE